MPLFFVSAGIVNSGADVSGTGDSLQLHMVLVKMPFEPLAVYRNSGVSWVPTVVIIKMLTKEGTTSNHPQAVIFVLMT